jgi:hypothetical protein
MTDDGHCESSAAQTQVLLMLDADFQIPHPKTTYNVFESMSSSYHWTSFFCKPPTRAEALEAPLHT